MNIADHYIRQYAPFISMIVGAAIYVFRDTLKTYLTTYIPTIVNPDLGTLGAIVFGIGLLAWVLRRK